MALYINGTKVVNSLVIDGDTGVSHSLVNKSAVATSSTARYKDRVDANNYISVSGNTVTLTRNNTANWLSFYTDILEADKSYAFIFDSITNTDSNIYIGTVSDISANPYSVTRIRTESLGQNTVGWVFTPTVSGVYDFLLGQSNTNPIVCVNPRLIAIDDVAEPSINPLDVDTTHPISCARVGATNLSKEIASFTTTTNGNITISVTGLTDCGSNEAYVALLINGVEKERGTLTTDVSTTINFHTISTIADETISLKFGWANNHTASFSGTYTCKSVGVSIPVIKVHSGKVNLATGAIVDDADYCYTDFIDFSNGYQMFDFGETAGAYVGCCWYKEDGTYGGNYWSANARFRYVDNSSYYSGSSIRKQRLTFRKVMLEKVILFDEVNNIAYTFNPYKIGN